PASSMSEPRKVTPKPSREGRIQECFWLIQYHDALRQAHQCGDQTDECLDPITEVADRDRSVEDRPRLLAHGLPVNHRSGSSIQELHMKDVHISWVNHKPVTKSLLD